MIEYLFLMPNSSYLFGLGSGNAKILAEFTKNIKYQEKSIN